MAYSTQVLQLAQQRLAQKKSDYESQKNQHLLEVYAQVPRIKEIDLALRQSMVLAAQTTFLKGEDSVTAMEKVRDANLALQEERRQLLRANFAPDYLMEEPMCSQCGGSGYMGSTMCRCLSQLCQEEQRKELHRLTTGQERFDRFRMDYYPDRMDSTIGASPRMVMERVLQICQRYGSAFSEHSGNLLFVGNTGLGKTFLSACIANEVVDKGYSVAYESAPRLFEKLNKNHFSPDEKSHREAEHLTECDLLILDDLGTELTTNFTVSALYSLLCDRLLARKPMIVSTNLNVDEIAQRYSPQIASRFQGEFQRLTFVGQDIRVLKNRGV